MGLEVYCKVFGIFFSFGVGIDVFTTLIFMLFSLFL